MEFCLLLNENGGEYALLTNGKSFEFYKIIFGKPISSRLIFTLDLSDSTALKNAVSFLQQLHRDSVIKNNFIPLWNKCEATDPYNIAGIICSEPIIKIMKKMIKQKYKEKCQDNTILAAVHKIINDKIDPLLVKPFKVGKTRNSKPRIEKETVVTILEENMGGDQ